MLKAIKIDLHLLLKFLTMKIHFIVVGKTNEKYFVAAENEYLKRMQRYTKLTYTVVPETRALKNVPEKEVKRKEGEAILKKINSTDRVILLDDKGADYSSKKFANKLSDMQMRGVKVVVFVVGGPYGFSEEVYQRANEKFSLSKMTFSHQMVRMIFLEQLYRGFTIIKGEPYHHE